MGFDPLHCSPMFYAPHPQYCPLCAQPNQCAMEMERSTGMKQPACWCTSPTFSSAFTPALLDQVPLQAKGRACICATCVLAHTQAQQQA